MDESLGLILLRLQQALDSSVNRQEPKQGLTLVVGFLSASRSVLVCFGV
jgi:hypothetical protein